MGKFNTGVKSDQRFGRLTVICMLDVVNGRRKVKCKCDCGNETTTDLYKLQKQITKSCGCLGREKANLARIRDLTNQTFGRLKALHQDSQKRSSKSIVWICECECGKITSVPSRDLVSGNTTSCGCSSVEFAKSLKDYNETYHTKDGVFVPLLKQKVQTNNKTGVKGVSVRIQNGRKRYIATITIQNKRRYLGIFDLLADAIEARKAAEKEYFSPYLNE